MEYVKDLLTISYEIYSQQRIRCTVLNKTRKLNSSIVFSWRIRVKFSFIFHIILLFEIYISLRLNFIFTQGNRMNNWTKILLRCAMSMIGAHICRRVYTSQSHISGVAIFHSCSKLGRRPEAYVVRSLAISLVRSSIWLRSKLRTSHFITTIFP